MHVACQISGLHLKELSAGELLFALSDAGLNLMPQDQDAQDAAVKSAALEAKVHRDMARVAGAFDFKSSRWNVKVGRYFYLALVNRPSNSSSHTVPGVSWERTGAPSKFEKPVFTRGETLKRSTTTWPWWRPTRSRSRTGWRQMWA